MRGRGQDRQRARTTAAGRERTQLMRMMLEENLETLPYLLPAVGPLPTNSDLGAADEVDGDDLLAETGPENEELPFEPADDPDEETTPVIEDLTLGDFLGSRPPQVLLRLTEEDGQIHAQICRAVTSPEEGQALDELRRFVEFCFTRAQISAEDRAGLLGLKPARILERLAWLGQLAVPGHTEIDYQGYRFTPHDRGLERYANKFAALPDGLPFSLRLLLLDERGKKKQQDDSPLAPIPWALKIAALKKISADIPQNEKVTYDRLRELLQGALAELGLPILKPSYDHVRFFVAALDRAGLTHLLPATRKRTRK